METDSGSRSMQTKWKTHNFAIYFICFYSFNHYKEEPFIGIAETLNIQIRNDCKE